MARGRRIVAAVLACGVVATACSDSGGDELQVVDDPVAASPESAPESDDPDGTVVGVGDDVTAVTMHPASGRIVLAVGGDDPRLEYREPSSPSADPVTVDVPGEVEDLQPAGDEVLATIPDADRLVRVTPPETDVDEQQVAGEPAGAAVVDDRTLVATREPAALAVGGDDRIAEEFASADRVLVAGDTVVVLDRLRSALFQVDVADRDVGLGLRAGQGATNAVADRYGRVLSVDTRTGALLAFSMDPFVLRQRYPVPGAPYGIAYDAERDLAWVTLTERNEVVGYDVAGAEPEEKARFATVRQPNSVTVEERTGSVVVASAAGEGMQVIKP